MSAECHKHGTDLVYPRGTWPIGVCPSCERDAVLASKLRAETARATQELLDRYWQALIDIKGYESWQGWPNQNEIARRALDG